MFAWILKTSAVRPGSLASTIRLSACCARGVYLHPHHNWFLSSALTDDDLVRVLEVTDQAFAEVAQGAG